MNGPMDTLKDHQSDLKLFSIYFERNRGKSHGRNVSRSEQTHPENDTEFVGGGIGGADSSGGGGGLSAATGSVRSRMRQTTETWKRAKESSILEMFSVGTCIGCPDIQNLDDRISSFMHVWTGNLRAEDHSIVLVLPFEAIQVRIVVRLLIFRCVYASL